MKTIKLISLTAVILLLFNCGGGYVKNPVDTMVRDLSTSTDAFSIILHDMDIQGNFSKDYRHQYRIIKTAKDTNPNDTIPGDVDEVITEWQEVPKSFFEKHVNNMGMVISSMDENGKVTKEASPPGYDNYIGNQRYGQWSQRNGSSFWVFYGQYAFMRSMFNMGGYPVRRSYYDTYRNDYYGRKPYYGTTTSGRRMYGTSSNYTSATRRNSTWSKNPRRNSFTQRVNRSVSRSNSRYSSSSMRSRSGGFGK